MANLLTEEEAKLVSRRRMLKLSLGAMGALAGTTIAGRALAASCSTRTPPQTSGPFYPEDPILRGNSDNDLTRVHGRTGQAAGEIVYIEGQVVDQDCQPVPNAVVDVWQANKDGRYNHTLDAQNPNPLDPNFQSRGIAITDLDGRYVFKTIIPGHYPASPTWMRPAHVHFRVSRMGYKELTTQMYFKGTPYLEEDHILQALPAAERESVIIDFETRVLATGERVRVGHFRIVLEKLPF